MIFPLDALNYKLISIEKDPLTPDECDNGVVFWMVSDSNNFSSFPYYSKLSSSSFEIDLNTIENK